MNNDFDNVSINENAGIYKIRINDLALILLKNKALLFSTMAIITAIFIVIAYVLPIKYKAEILFSPVIEESGNKSLMRLAGQLGGLASFAGLSFGENNSKEESLAILKSRKFIYSFISTENLLPALFPKIWDENTGQWKVTDESETPTLEKAYTLFTKKIMSVQESKKNDLVILSIELKDKELAAKWANLILKRANEYIRDKAVIEAKKSLNFLEKELNKTSIVELQNAIYKIMETQINKVMLANVRDDYAFKVIDPAVSPDDKDFSKPRRGVIIFIGIVLGIIFGILAVNIKENIHKREE